MKDVIAIVLAAGRGTRMNSSVPKVMHEILGRPVITYVLDALKAAGVKKIITVAGFGSALLKDAAAGTKVVLQKKLLGSGDAVKTARRALLRHSGPVLVICGDTPLIRPDTIKALVGKHRSSGASAVILTSIVEDALSYGRIVRDSTSRIMKIAEEEESRDYGVGINEINVGAYCFDAKELFDSLAEVKPVNRKKEYYLTDAINILYNKGRAIESVISGDVSEFVGINTRIDLAQAAAIMKNKVLEKLMLSGVTIEDPATTIVHPGAKIGSDTVIRSNTVIESDVVIGNKCEIGPFARIRPGTKIGDRVEIGNFVELVRTRVAGGTKIKHHTYLGDTIVGKGVNIGAGTITANYDGVRKNRTTIGDGAFIGVGAILIAPVKIGKAATVGAGCVVPKDHDVPKGATVVGVPARILKKSRTFF